MPRQQKKYHFIYKTTNLITNRYYIGMHSTDDLSDGYLGSGRRLKSSIKKYGIDNHKFEIIEFHPNRDSLTIKEKQIVSDRLLTDPLCLNLAPGGQGGNLHKWTDLSKQLLSESLKKRPNTWGHKVSAANKGKRQSDEIIKKAALSRTGDRNGSWLGVDLDLLSKYRFQDNLTITEIANAMNISVSTVKRKLSILNKSI